MFELFVNKSKVIFDTQRNEQNLTLNLMFLAAIQ
jgi:hypothetical protein